MKVTITLKSGNIEVLNTVMKISFPKVKTIKFTLENGLCECFYTKAIKEITMGD